ncbi:MAG: three-Cys-motif partner protein TcmP [Nitrospirales bacterium]|nr:three-Cys-motif partner protein TcmP [Nitrospirales bacterium]
MIEKLPRLEHDGLITPEVGQWAEFKYRLVWNYAKMFSSSMKSRWDARVYIDLYAGSGRSRIENTNIIVPASPLLALNIADRFDKYIFCDSDSAKISALKERVARDCPDINVCFVEADVNSNIEEIISKLPPYRRDFRVLSFCFVDPYSTKNLKFQTIQKLSEGYMDFLVLVPSIMDANRNIDAYYIHESNSAVDDFTGNPHWRDEWRSQRDRWDNFGSYFADLFGRQMKALGYLYNGLSDMELVRSIEKNLPLYHLAFFSRSKLGRKFWKEARKYSDDQLDLL